MSDLNCPYCDAENEVNHDDGAGYDEDKAHEMECRECGKMFQFTTSISFHYAPHKADCLNDGNHDYQWSKTYPPEYARRRCTICGGEIGLYRYQEDLVTTTTLTRKRIRQLPQTANDTNQKEQMPTLLRSKSN
jgi:ribosomal protein S14